MANYNSSEETPGSYALRAALAPGLLWAASFLCATTMRVPVAVLLCTPTLAFLGLGAWFRGARIYNSSTPSAGILAGWGMAVRIALAALLWITVAQYIYFRFLDNGQLLQTMEISLEDMSHLFPVSSEQIEEMRVLLTSPERLTFQLCLGNAQLLLLLSLPLSLLTRIGLRPNR